MAVAEQLEQSKYVKRQIGILQMYLADVLMNTYGDARKSYLQEAAKNCTEALTIFHRLNELNMKNEANHRLGRIRYYKMIEAEEQAYRESARIKESQGNLAEAALDWNELAFSVESSSRRHEEAEAWFRKAIEAGKAGKDMVNVPEMLNNLANLIQTNYPDRLPEARQLVEEALAIRKTLDPTVSEIWMSYDVLLLIAEQEGDGEKAGEYRRLRDLNRV